MGLDREDLAARVLVAFAGGPSGPDNGKEAADVAASWADALIARLRPATVAPVADAAPTDPRRTVGAVVRDSLNFEWIVTKPDMARALRAPDAGDVAVSSHWTFVRWATRAECDRHGIPYVERGAAPSPAAAPDHPTAASFAARRGQGAEGDQHPAAYVPKVGDRVMHAGPDDGRRFVVTAVDAFAVIRVDSKRSAFCVSGPWIDNAAPVYDGPATAAERAAAGLPPITPDHPQGGQGAEAEGRVGDQRVAAGLDAPAKEPAFDETSEREAAVDIAKDRGLDVAEEVGFVAGWLARARIAAKGGAS